MEKKFQINYEINYEFGISKLKEMWCSNWNKFIFDMWLWNYETSHWFLLEIWIKRIKKLKFKII